MTGGIAQRRFPRYSCHLPVEVIYSTVQCAHHIVQISRGGCLLLPPIFDSTSPEVVVTFQLEDGQPPVRAKGEIVYTISDKGSGVAFTEISEFNRDLIDSFFSKKTSREQPTGT